MKKVFLLVFIIFLFILPHTLFSIETGNIAGKVYIRKTGKPLFQANVYVEDFKMGVLTRQDGSFIIKNIPAGIHTITVNFMGYGKQSKKVEIKTNLTTTVMFSLKMKPIGIAGITVTATRAIKRETPIAFTDITKSEIDDKYTTQDLPLLLEAVPGLFANSTGIGEAQITMRGFEADKIQILINGIPVNDPESQKVYWSNWTGLSSTVKSVQVQRGAGSSLYGSGAFGGSINIETIATNPQRNWILRTSGGNYYSGSKVANGKGDLKIYNPYNYNVSLRYESGGLYDNKYNYSVMLEKKAGDSYIIGTDYDGYSVGVEAQSIIGAHKINLSFIGAPQKHNNVYFKSDPKLFDILGRNYNRNNSGYQENYYFKPQFSVRDEWKISESQLIMTNTFVTKGNGGGKYLSQSIFNVENGDVTFMPLHTANQEEINFGRHACYIYELTDSSCIFEGYNPSDSNYYGLPTYHGNPVMSAANIFDPPAKYTYTWLNDHISDHFQWGFNTYYKNEINPMLTFVLGGEYRHWKADHIGKRRDFRYLDSDTDSLGVYSIFQEQYDETSSVNNLSCFARFSLKPVKNMNIMIDGQLASYHSHVNENPITIYDIGTGDPTEYTFYSTKNTPLINPNTGEVIIDTLTGKPVKKFDSDDYKKTYNFFSPKFGINYNISKYLNFMTNYSISYKEPKTMQWYSGYDGPDGNQMYTVHLVDSTGGEYKEYTVEHFYGELKPEKINTLEFGIGYDGSIIDLNANYYISNYKDKIEYVTIPVTNYYYDDEGDSIYIQERDESLVLNAGQARHQGLELSNKINYYNFDFSSSLTLAQYRWVEMNIEEIFDVKAEEMEGKVVPFSPEKMFNFSTGYTFHGLPLNGKLRVGLNGKWQDDYYANYTNEHIANYIWNTNSGQYEPEQEFFKSIEGDYWYDEEAGEYKLLSETQGQFPENIIHYGQRVKMISTKLPYFFEMGGNIKYSFKIGNKDAYIKLAFNNILNRKQNFFSANVKTDYNRMTYKTADDGQYVVDENGDKILVEDKWCSKDKLYITPAPLFNVFFTLQISF